MKNFIEWIIRNLGYKSTIPNANIGLYVAQDFLIRGLQISLNELVYLKSWKCNIPLFSEYQDNSARGGKGFFEMRAFVTFSTSSSFVIRSAYALLHISCESAEYMWKPNHCGSYICIDGEKFHELLCDFRSGNISLGKEGYGSHVSEEFLTEAATFPWKELRVT